MTGLLFPAGLGAEALAELDLILRLSQSPYHVLHTIRWVLDRKDPTTYAWCERAIRRALERSPRRGGLHYLLGGLALVRGDPPEVVLAHWRRGAELPPEDILPPDWLAALERTYGSDLPGLEELKSGR
jgi:hypothetical protein